MKRITLLTSFLVSDADKLYQDLKCVEGYEKIHENGAYPFIQEVDDLLTDHQHDLFKQVVKDLNLSCIFHKGKYFYSGPAVEVSDDDSVDRVVEAAHQAGIDVAVECLDNGNQMVYPD